MKKTLLLCFIHGFKGDDMTFGGFVDHLRALVSHALPKIDVATVVYPKFDTRGDLKECVGRFREWLQNKVIDLEVEAKTPSPSIDPSVHTILVGHSMGGIVAADTVLDITSDQPLTQSPDTHSFMFPFIQGILAFDTPYLGISPGVVAHGAEGHYNTLTQLSSLVGGFWGATVGSSSADKTPNQKQAQKPKAILPPPEAPVSVKGTITTTTKTTKTTPLQADIDTATPGWQRWGKIAMVAGAASALAAGGAAAYVKREQITEGWSWVGSHLEFVGCLVKGEEMKQRVQRITELVEKEGLGFADLYTVLGRNAAPASTANKSVTATGLMRGPRRTFLNVPKSEARKYFIEQVNDAATDETWAHMSMFFPRDNPGYYTMGEQGKELIVRWVTNDENWYRTSSSSSSSNPTDPEVYMSGNDGE